MNERNDAEPPEPVFSSAPHRLAAREVCPC